MIRESAESERGNTAFFPLLRQKPIRSCVTSISTAVEMDVTHGLGGAEELTVDFREKLFCQRVDLLPAIVLWVEFFR